MTPPAVTAVLVTYRSAGVVGAALEALRPAQADGALGVIVVDNDSPDGTADRVAAEHPWATLVRSGGNLGYGRGCNLGFSRVASPYVLFMNPDVVITPAAIEALRAFLAARPRAGAAAPATRLAGSAWQHAGGLTTPWSVLARAAGGRVPVRTVSGGQPALRADWLCGAVFLMPSALFRELGGFDPRFFLYFEETDLCRRIRAAGRELWLVGDAEAAHRRGDSARQVDPSLAEGECLPAHFYPSRYYYLVKHFGRVAAALAEGGELAAYGAKDLLRALRRDRRESLLGRRLKAPVFACPPAWSGP